MLDAGRFSWVCVGGDCYLGLSISPLLSLSCGLCVSCETGLCWSIWFWLGTHREDLLHLSPCRVPWETTDVLACYVIPIHLHRPAGCLPFSNLLLPHSALLFPFLLYSVHFYPPFSSSFLALSLLPHSWVEPTTVALHGPTILSWHWDPHARKCWPFTLPNV